MSGGPNLPGRKFSLEKHPGFWLRLGPLPSAGQTWMGTRHPASPSQSLPWIILWVISLDLCAHLQVDQFLPSVLSR